MHPSLLPALLAFAILSLPALAQKPRTVDDALARFAEVREQAEGRRYRAVRDLGRFADDRVSAVLLGQLGGAESISYRQAVVRAIGFKERTGAVAPLRELLISCRNPRLADSIAQAMVGQADAGVRVLAELLPDAANQSVQRAAICRGLGRSDLPVARTALRVEVQRAPGLARLAPLRGLAACRGDSTVDQLRRRLAGDKSRLVAAAALEQLAAHGDQQAPKLAIELARRLGPRDGANLHVAVLLGLLQRPQQSHYPAMLTATALAEDPFGKGREQAWERALQDASLIAWLARDGTTSKSVAERVATARALARAPTEHHDQARKALAKLLSSREADVVQAAATALVVVGGAAAEQALVALAAKPHRDTVAIAIGGLHALRQQTAGWREELLRWSTHKLPAARAAALRALAGTTPLDASALSAGSTNLTHKDWRVRAAAIELLVATRSATVPPLLFIRLQKEKARLRQDVVDALLQLTGLQFPSTKDWKKWWAKEGATWTPLAQPKPEQPHRDATGITYWDIPLRSDRVTFVVDVSGSMAQPFGTGNDTRLAEARRQLGRVFDQLPRKARVNVIAFANDARPLFDKLQTLDKKRRKLADAFVDGWTSRGYTDVHDAMRRAFADAAVDTIFLLTDGRPSAGTIVAADELAAEVARWNLGRGIRIHTIAIGASSEFLERLAADSGGEHTVAR